MKGRSFIVLAHTIGAHRHEAHHLDAARDHEIIGAGDDALRGEIQRLLGRAAFAIERDCGHALGKARGQHGLAADIAGLLPDLDDAAGDDVFDQAPDRRPSAARAPAATAA